jgi:hypothetical protein
MEAINDCKVEATQAVKLPQYGTEGRRSQLIRDKEGTLNSLREGAGIDVHSHDLRAMEVGRECDG